MLDVKQIISALPKLTKAELRQLRQAIDFIDGKSTLKKASGWQQTEDWLTPGLLYELKRRGLTYGYLDEQRLKNMAPNYAADSEVVRENLREKLKQSKALISTKRLDHAELVAFGRIAARALADYLQPVASLGLKFLLTNVGKISEALEQSYPEYLQSSMIWMVVTHSESKGNSL